MELARRVVDLVVDKMGSDVVLMQIGELSLIADYFVICSGETARQLDAIRYELQKQLKTEGEYPVGTEGTPESGWVLMDYGSVVSTSSLRHSGSATSLSVSGVMRRSSCELHKPNRLVAGFALRQRRSMPSSLASRVAMGDSCQSRQQYRPSWSPLSAGDLQGQTDQRVDAWVRCG